MFYSLEAANNCIQKLPSAAAKYSLTFSIAIPDGDRKLTYILIFTLLSGASKGFMKAFKAFINLLRHQKEVWK